MTQTVQLKGIGKANAKFERAKLARVHTPEAAAAATPARLIAALRGHLSVIPIAVNAQPD